MRQGSVRRLFGACDRLYHSRALCDFVTPGNTSLSVWWPYLPRHRLGVNRCQRVAGRALSTGKVSVGMLQLFNSTPVVPRFGIARKAGLALGLMGVAVVTAALPTTAQASEWPSKVEAVYRITFNGFDIGSFNFRSKVGARGYVLDGNAEISALLGVVSWRGVTRSSGQVSGRSPKPSGYLFNFRSNNKGGMIKMGFDKGKVSSISQVPVLPVKPGEIPLKRSHLKGVLDPLSAVMALTKPRGKNPCDQKLEVFDGKQRFNLALSYKKQEAIGETRIAGQPNIAIVCRVSYQPVSGYKPTAETHRLSQGNALEVALRPVPGAKLYIPHEIRISTIAGPVKLTASRVDITTDEKRRIALVSR